MSTRVAQREETRRRIVTAAARVFAEKGFRSASTRDIAAAAKVNQGLITYHFGSKEKLWKAAMDRIFGALAEAFSRIGDDVGGADFRERAREALRRYVRFAAAHPELFRLMVEEGKYADARLRWLVDTHMRPQYDRFATIVATLNPDADPRSLPHLFYTLAGGGSMIFALRPECKRLTGIDPAKPEVIEAHADFLARLLVP